MVRMGNETGTTEVANSAIIVRKLYSTISDAGSAIAITDEMRLERDGTDGGLRITRLNASNLNITCTGITGASTQVIYRSDFASAGTSQVFTDAQNVLHYDCSFGNTYNAANITHAVWDRRVSDYWWMGFLTSTTNQ